MMPSVLSVLAGLNGLLLSLIALLHLYWAFGGAWGLRVALPTLAETSQKVLSPGWLACLIVCSGLLLFLSIYFSLAFGRGDVLPFQLGHWGVWVPGLIFLARAIGEFRYVGFFKTIRNTPFGRNDTRYYSPLCLYLGVSSVLIAIL